VTLSRRLRQAQHGVSTIRRTAAAGPAARRRPASRTRMVGDKLFVANTHAHAVFFGFFPPGGLGKL